MRATMHTFTSFIVRKRVVATARIYDGIWISTKAEITGHLLTWDIALQMLVFAQPAEEVKRKGGKNQMKALLYV